MGDYEELDTELIEYFKTVYPNEGVVYIKDGKVLPQTNIHDKPEGGFLVDALSFMKVKPDAIVHSHPSGDPTPSEDDVLLRNTTGVDIGIYGCNPKKEVRCVWL